MLIQASRLVISQMLRITRQWLPTPFTVSTDGWMVTIFRLHNARRLVQPGPHEVGHSVSQSATAAGHQTHFEYSTSVVSSVQLAMQAGCLFQTLFLLAILDCFDNKSTKPTKSAKTIIPPLLFLRFMKKSRYKVSVVLGFESTTEFIDCWINMCNHNHNN